MALQYKNKINHKDTKYTKGNGFFSVMKVSVYAIRRNARRVASLLA